MTRHRALRRFTFKHFDFDFDLSIVKHQWNAEAFMAAADLGRPFRLVCDRLGLEEATVGDRIKAYALSRLYQDSLRLTARQIELMEQYYEEPILGVTFGELLSDIMYSDPHDWFGVFENSLLFLNDMGLGERGLPSTSSLDYDQRRRIALRLFGDMPLEIDRARTGGDTTGATRFRWSRLGYKEGAAYRMFVGYLTKEQFLCPHPNDILLNDRRIRMIEQEDIFLSILKEIASNQHVAEDRLLYDWRPGTGFLCYASSKIFRSGIFEQAEDRGKAETIVKLTALLSLIGSPSLRELLFHNLLNEGGQPFNFLADEDGELLEGDGWDDLQLSTDIGKEGHMARYISLIFMSELAVKAFYRDKLRETIELLGHLHLGETVDAEQEDRAEIERLKARLVPIVLFKDCGNKWGEQTDRRSLDYTDAPDDIFRLLYKWVYRLRKDYGDGSRGGSGLRWWRQWLRESGYDSFVSDDQFIELFEDWSNAYRNYANIAPEGLGLIDVEKLLKGI